MRQYRLGWLERWYAAHTPPHVVGWSLSLPETRSSPERVLDAFRVLMTRHPRALRSTLDRSIASRPRMFIAQERPLPFRVIPRSELWRAAEYELHRPFYDGELLWRAVWDGNQLITTFHHLIADGHAAAVWAREFCALLDGRELPARHDDDSPLDRRLSLRPRWSALASELSASESRYECGDHEPIAEPLRTELESWHCNRELLNKLARRARDERTSMHGVLTTAALIASAVSIGADRLGADRLGADRAEVFPFRARMTTPVSLRPFCRPPPDGMGAFVGSVDNDLVLLGPTTFWDFAVHYRRRLAEAVPKSHHRLGLLRFAGDLTKLNDKLSVVHPNGRTGTLEVSNLGRLEALGGYAFWFFQGNHYPGPRYTVSVATCAERQELRLVLSIPAPLVSRTEGRVFMRALATVLQAISETSRADPSFSELAVLAACCSSAC